MVETAEQKRAKIVKLLRSAADALIPDHARTPQSNPSTLKPQDVLALFDIADDLQRLDTGITAEWLLASKKPGRRDACVIEAQVAGWTQRLIDEYGVPKTNAYDAMATWLELETPRPNIIKAGAIGAKIGRWHEKYKDSDDPDIKRAFIDGQTGKFGPEVLCSGEVPRNLQAFEAVVKWEYTVLTNYP